jgi:hypothetical protein
MPYFVIWAPMNHPPLPAVALDVIEAIVVPPVTAVPTTAVVQPTMILIVLAFVTDAVDP